MSTEPFEPRRTRHAPERAEKSSVSRRTLLGLGGAVVLGGGLYGAVTVLRPGSGPADSSGAPAAGTPGGTAQGSTGSPPGVTPSWVQDFQAGHGWTVGGNGTASSNLNDTALHQTGTQSARVTTDGSGRQSFVHKLGMPPIDMTGRMIRLVFRIEDTAHLHRIIFLVGGGGLADSFHWDFHTQSSGNADAVRSGEWVTVHLQWADVTLPAAGAYSVSRVGVPSTKSGFTDMSFAVYDDGHGPVTYHLQEVAVLPDTTRTYPHGVVSITFDDSYASVFANAAPVMQRHGFKGTLYNIAQMIGTPNYLTLAHLSTLQESQGWDMAGHAYGTAAHAAGYNKLTAAQVDADLEQLRTWQTSNGYKSKHFAYPHGAIQETSDGVPVDQIAAKYYASARSIIEDGTESYPPAMPYRLRAVTGLNDGVGTTGEKLNFAVGLGGALDRCADDGAWLIFCFHDVVTRAPATSSEISVSGFSRVMDAIAAKNVTVATVDEVMSKHP